MVVGIAFCRQPFFAETIPRGGFSAAAAASPAPPARFPLSSGWWPLARFSPSFSTTLAANTLLGKPRFLVAAGPLGGRERPALASASPV